MCLSGERAWRSDWTSKAARHDGDEVRLEVWKLKEHADAGDAGRSRGDAVRGVGCGHASEGVDGHGLGGLAGGVESAEAGGGSDFSSLDRLSEDRGEEGEGGLLIARAANFVEGVTTDADDGSRQEDADLGRGEFAGGRGEVHAMGAGGERDVGTAGDEDAGSDAGRGGANGLHDAAGKGNQSGGREVLFPQQKKSQAFACQPGAMGY